MVNNRDTLTYPEKVMTCEISSLSVYHGHLLFHRNSIEAL